MLLDRRAAGLSAAEGLRLEEHLASCEPCNRDGRLLGGLRSIAYEIDGTLAPHARARVIESAFARVNADRAAGERGRMHASLRMAAVLAVAAGAAFALRAVLVPAAPIAPAAAPAAPAAAPQVRPAVASGDRVLGGVIEIDGRPLETGAPLTSGAVLHASADARIAVAHATVALRANTDVRWQAPQTLHLDAGSVVADVDPDPHKPFVVQTARFAVMVLGTRFEVALDRVSVEHGHVLVVAPDDSLLADLHGGDSYTYEPPAAAPPTATATKHAPERARAAKAPAARPDPAALIERARTQLGGKQVGAARATIDAALGLAPEPRLRAEALTLRAECALVDGDPALAIEAYLRVARAFAELPAGENALFAAARLEADRQRSAAAAQLLERYLERYPHGRFEREARARLRTLSAALDHAQ
jgi:hypothetical protein